MKATKQEVRKIKALFSSPDKGNWVLAIELCKAFALDYKTLCLPAVKKAYRAGDTDSLVMFGWLPLELPAIATKNTHNWSPGRNAYERRYNEKKYKEEIQHWKKQTGKLVGDDKFDIEISYSESCSCVRKSMWYYVLKDGALEKTNLTGFKNHFIALGYCID